MQWPFRKFYCSSTIYGSCSSFSGALGWRQRTFFWDSSRWNVSPNLLEHYLAVSYLPYVVVANTTQTLAISPILTSTLSKTCREARKNVRGSDCTSIVENRSHGGIWTYLIVSPRSVVACEDARNMNIKTARMPSLYAECGPLSSCNVSGRI